MSLQPKLRLSHIRRTYSKLEEVENPHRIVDSPASSPRFHPQSLSSSPARQNSLEIGLRGMKFHDGNAADVPLSIVD
jgi:hypothetical protein